MGVLEFLKLKKSPASAAVKSPIEMSSDELLKEESALRYDIGALDRERQEVNNRMQKVKRDGLKATGDQQMRMAEEYRDLALDLERVRRESATLHKTQRLIKRLRYYKERERRYKRPYLDIGKIQWEQLADLVREQEIEDSEFETRLDRLLGVREVQMQEDPVESEVKGILAEWNREQLVQAEGGHETEHPEARKGEVTREPETEF